MSGLVLLVATWNCWISYKNRYAGLLVLHLLYLPTCYSDRLHDFSVTIPKCYKAVYVNNFFPPRARLWNYLPIECFPLTYDLNGFKSRINKHLFSFFLNRFPVCFNLFVLLFLVTPCLVVAVQHFME